MTYGQTPLKKNRTCFTQP